MLTSIQDFSWLVPKFLVMDRGEGARLYSVPCPLFQLKILRREGRSTTKREQAGIGSSMDKAQ